MQMNNGLRVFNTNSRLTSGAHRLRGRLPLHLRLDDRALLARRQCHRSRPCSDYVRVRTTAKGNPLPESHFVDISNEIAPSHQQDELSAQPQGHPPTDPSKVSEVRTLAGRDVARFAKVKEDDRGPPFVYLLRLGAASELNNYREE
jgi:hypothetical protein